jgi:hypothetical protein
VSADRGLGSAENISLVEQLADTLGAAVNALLAHGRQLSNAFAGTGQEAPTGRSRQVLGGRASIP